MNIDDIINLLLIYKSDTKHINLNEIKEIKICKERLLVYSNENVCQVPMIMLDKKLKGE